MVFTLVGVCHGSSVAVFCPVLTGIGILRLSSAHRCALVMILVHCVISRPNVVMKNQSRHNWVKSCGFVKQSFDNFVRLFLFHQILYDNDWNSTNGNELLNNALRTKFSVGHDLYVSITFCLKFWSYQTKNVSIFSKIVLNNNTCVSFALFMTILLSCVQWIIVMTHGSMSGIDQSISFFGILVAIMLVWISLTMMSSCVISLTTKGLASNHCVALMYNIHPIIVTMYFFIDIVL